jgi:hypothetical protein
MAIDGHVLSAQMLMVELVLVKKAIMASVVSLVPLKTWVCALGEDSFGSVNAALVLNYNNFFPYRRQGHRVSYSEGVCRLT